MKKPLLIALLLILATLSIYFQVHRFSFIIFDDSTYVYSNKIVLSGISVASTQWAFTSMEAGNWTPLTWLSYLIDIRLFGPHPGKLHLVNVLLHICNVVFLFLTMRSMQCDLPRSAFVAALFAVHPLHVESVAWIAERKDVLSTLFFILMIWSYSGYVKNPYYCKNPSTFRYLLTLSFFLCALMAKPMVVTAPFVLLLLDFWPLNRFVEKRYLENTTSLDTSVVWRLVWEKVPFFLLSLIVSTITLLAQSRANSVVSLQSLPIDVRIANAFVGYVFYLWKTFFPVNLSIIYAHHGEIVLWETLTSFLLFACISIFAIRIYKKAPFLITGWLWYLGTLVPVIGIVQVGQQAYADRYTYIPLIGVFIIVVWGAHGIATWLNKVKTCALLGTAILGFLALLSYNQVGYWMNSYSLFGHAVDIDPSNAVARNILGYAYEIEGGDLDTAVTQYSAALKLQPDNVLIRRNIARALAKKGDNEQALSHLDEALQINGESAEAYYDYGALLVNLDRTDEAINFLKKAIYLEPGFAEAYNQLGVAYKLEGNVALAIAHFEKAKLIKPNYDEAKANLKSITEDKSNVRRTSVTKWRE